MNKWEVVIPKQRVALAKSEEEAEKKAKALRSKHGFDFKVSPRPHCAEVCWCGDDHSP